MRRPPRVLALLGALVAFALHAQPVAPTPEQVARLRALAATPQPLVAAVPLSVDTSSREQVRQFYRSIYNASEGVSLGWTGNYTATDPVLAAGDTSAALKEAVRLRINFFRALTGVPAGITFNSAYSAKDQQAALMMSANNALNHYPPNTWTYYTADGATAAGNSNIAVGDSGPDAITGYMIDNAVPSDPTNNNAVGHRRWLFYPQTQQMGTGDVAGSNTVVFGSGPTAINPSSANATWVIDAQFGTTRPATRTPYVAYPPAGYVPYQLVWPRWSFSYPGADFSTATVTMTRNSASVAVALETLSPGAGENTLVWLYNGLPSSSDAPHPKPSSDTTYTVNVNNVKIGAATQNFSYNVTVFDPDVAGSDYAPATVSIPATLSVGQATAYSVTAPAFASQYEFRPLQFAAFTKTYNAESGLDGIVALTESYPTVVTDTVGAGTASYHLATPDTSILTQTLTLPETFYAANSAASLTFLSRLSWASGQQIAHVQIALDNGTAWFDVLTQTGTDGAGDSGFATRTVPLSAYAGRTFRVRFAYSYTGSGTYYPQTSAGVGWYLDNIAISGVQTATGGSSTVNPVGTGGSFTAAAAGSFGVQARGLFFGTYPMEWGPVTAVTASAGPPITTQPLGHTIAVGSTVVFSVEATGTGLTYQWARNGVNLATATSARLIVSNAQTGDAGAYTVAVGNGTATTTSSAATLAVSATSNPGRIVNLSIRGPSGTGSNVLIMGVVTGGDGTAGNTNLLIRGVGPSIIPAPFNVIDALLDPAIQVSAFPSGTVVASNDNWGGTAALKAAAVTTGAFPLISDTSLDAALVSDFPRGLYSVFVSGNNATTGSVLGEIYDTGYPATYNPAVPRLINISTRTYIGATNTLIAGFVIFGNTAKTVLIRGIGPNPPFASVIGAANVLPDPQLDLYHSGVRILTNDNWGGDPQLTTIGNSVGAQALTDPASKDAVLLVTLDPGVYSALDFGVNSASGITLIEVYAVP